MGDHVLLSRPIFISQAIYKAAGVPRISPRWRDAILPVKSSDYVSEERDTRDSPLSWVYRGNRNTRMISRSFAKGTTVRTRRVTWAGTDVLVMCETFRPNYNEMYISSLFFPASISPCLAPPHTSPTSTRNHLFGTGSILSSLRCFLGIDGRSRAGDAPSISLPPESISDNILETTLCTTNRKRYIQSHACQIP